MLGVGLFLSFFVSVSSLQCYHHALQVDYKTVNDLGLKECAPHHKFCIYLSLTAFVPRERHPHPVHFEQVGCHSGMSYDIEEEKNYINRPREEICSKEFILPHKESFLWKETERIYNMTERVNEVHCCTTDGCNKEFYDMVGGGQKPQGWFKRIYGSVTKLF